MKKIMLIALYSVFIPNKSVAMNKPEETYPTSSNPPINYHLIEESKIQKRHRNTTRDESEDSYADSAKKKELSETQIAKEKENFQRGLSCFKLYQYNFALPYFKLAGENSKAHYYIGAIYEFGALPEINRDFEEALYWYNKAAANDDKEAKKAIERVNKKKQYPFLPNFITYYIY